MASPLSIFIQFAANDCGWSGQGFALITSWAHPLFLKAKTEANKVDNPNLHICKTTLDPPVFESDTMAHTFIRCCLDIIHEPLKVQT